MATEKVLLAREVRYAPVSAYEGPFFLAADIGGTNSNFGVFSRAHSRPVLLVSLHYKSKGIIDFSVLLSQVTHYIFDRYKLVCEKACIGAAGIIYPTRSSVRPTHLSYEINLEAILKVVPFKEIMLINDFEAVALGIELLEPKDLVVVQGGVESLHANKACLGAGTGLGKSMVTWSVESACYLPVASEGGHADASFQSKEEIELMEFLYRTYGDCPISWENLLSGTGIQKLYQFLGTRKTYPVTQATVEIQKHDFNPDRISYYARNDERCKDTFDLYVRFYARCAKNFALDALALNGIYIAGGIAAKNISLFFDPQFKEEFRQCGRHSDVLARIPLSIIANYNVSLYGAVKAIELHEEGLL